MSTLTDRYVDAVLRRVPSHQRPEIERELRASIADALEEHEHRGEHEGGSEGEGTPRPEEAARAEEAVRAEVAVLTELGDPAKLAAGYSDEPLWLIGPERFLDYTRLLTALLVSVVPVVALAAGLPVGLQGDWWGAVWDGLGAGLTAFAHLVCWTTLGFAIFERLPLPGRTGSKAWTPDALPKRPSRRLRFTELVLETVATVLFGALILISPRFGVLSPQLWETGQVYVFLGLVVAALASSFAKYYARWTVPVAVAGSLAGVASAVMLIWLAANDRVLNPAAGLPGWINTVLIVISAFTILNTVIDGVARAREELP
ncbi:hypothetical protein [Nonomuraea typhae]|uniref:hypothetical protein n=1 Tax=Nonomuraea typhae TaxID=2603600 RepID=UPI0012FC5361|nr:hypothetical protein [Nonomuraea typhae]